MIKRSKWNTGKLYTDYTVYSLAFCTRGLTCNFSFYFGAGNGFLCQLRYFFVVVLLFPILPYYIIILSLSRCFLLYVFNSFYLFLCLIYIPPTPPSPLSYLVNYKVKLYLQFITFRPSVATLYILFYLSCS